MATKNLTTRLGMTRQQGITIGVLVVALIGAIFYGQAGTPPEESGTAAAVTAPASPTASATPDPAAAPAGRSTHWPAVTLDRMLQHNPFKHIAEPVEVVEEPPPETPVETPEEVSAASKAAELAARQEEQQKKVQAILAEFQEQKVQLVFRSGNKVSALIGKRLIHEGDLIDGVRIVSIQPSGVIVEPEPASE